MSYLNPNRPVRGNLACSGCGYNLRGLPRTSQCPECGGYIQDSIRADLERSHYQRLRRFFLLLPACAGILIIIVLAGSLLRGC